MSSSKLIDGESLTAYERWELPHVENSDRRHGAVSEEEMAVEPLTAEQLEQIQREAYDEAYKSAYEEGLEAGRKAGEAEVHAAVQRLEQVMHALAEPLEAVDEEVEQELMQLTLAVARQLIRRELRNDPGEVVGVVREALGSLPAAQRKVQLFLHPEDAEIVRQAMPAAEDEESAWRIVEEPGLTRGGCRVETENSKIDATVEKRLAAVAAKLLGGERSDDATDAH